MLKKIIATSAATCLALQIGLGASTASASDIKGHWAEKDMQHLIDKRVLAGEGNELYFPNRQVTRAEMASFLVRALKLTNANNAKTFKDVKANAWYADTVAIASSYGLVNGYTDGTFKPNQRITRAEMASMLVGGLRLAGVDTSKKAPINFKDATKIADWSKSAIEVVYAYELMGGKPGFVFAPSDQATRAEAATVIYNLMYVDPEAPERPKPGVSYEKVISYPLDYKKALKAQVNASTPPKVDGGSRFSAAEPAVDYFLNPANFPSSTPEYYQFLRLDTPVIGVEESKLNNGLLKGLGVLEGHAATFMKAGRQLQINEFYLISHASHETGNGTSPLSTGIEVGLNANGVATMVTEANRAQLTDIKKTYNVYGIGATDTNTLRGGSERAYNEGWFSVEEAIIGGAKFIRERYIDKGRHTLYTMKWNMAVPGSWQYATHVQWATIAANNMHKMYVATDAVTTAVREFEVPRYVNQPAKSAMPPMEQWYAVDPKLAGEFGIVAVEHVNLNVRSYPSTRATKLGELVNGARVEIVGTNGGWYKVKYNASGNTGWVEGSYLKLVSELPKTPGNGSTALTEGLLDRSAALAGVQHGDLTDRIDMSWVDVE